MIKQLRRSDPVSTAEAVEKADCPDCGATRGNPCVYMVRPEAPYPPDMEPQSWMPGTWRRYLENVGKPTRKAHNGRMEVIRRKRPVRHRPTGPSVPLWEVAARTEHAIELRRAVEAVAAYDAAERAWLGRWLKAHGAMFGTDWRAVHYHPEWNEAEARAERAIDALRDGLITPTEARQELWWASILRGRAHRG